VKTADFDYELPIELIAQTPVEPRDASRLLVLDRATGKLAHCIFRELGEYFNPGDLLVFNQTRVMPARLYAHKIPGGGQIEILLLKKIDELTWEALIGGKGLVAGKRFEVDGGPQAEVIKVLDGPGRLLRFDRPLDPLFNRIGHVPLPPYIHSPLADPERYQTVYARELGSAAAPTAGLHFTQGLIESLQQRGVRIGWVTLHVGLDTFAPVAETNPAGHIIHKEWCQVGAETAAEVRAARQAGNRIIAVGTTTVRTLESAARSANPDQVILPFEGSTDLFILPGFNFRIVDALITNFHLPRSTLLMLVSAFTGREQILAVYEEAKRNLYRFYSFGDAMLIL
jgi:S-adenosylmethionine:tRNA ribosyltransferase-isomerase